MRIEKPRVRKTPNGRHLYTATLKGHGTYGWGNTPDEARAKLAENLERVRQEKLSEAHRLSP